MSEAITFLFEVVVNYLSKLLQVIYLSKLLQVILIKGLYAKLQVEIHAKMTMPDLQWFP